MDQETFNLSIRKFLKMARVTSKRDIKQAAQKAADKLGTDFAVKMTLEIPALGVKVPFDGEIKLK